MRRYRGERPLIDVKGRTAVIVDDGLATGSTMAAAVAVLRERGARRVVVAVPVGSPQAVDWLRGLADEVICPCIPSDFRAVGVYYDDFVQVGDAEVLRLLSTPA